MGSTGAKNGYHNLIHGLHVMKECFSAIMFYGTTINRREARSLLIAGLVHDLNHPGKRFLDEYNVSNTIDSFKANCHESDRSEIEAISHIIRFTQYPHLPEEKLSRNLLGDIIRDADLSQVFFDSNRWIQEVIIGLSAEWNMPPLQLLNNQLNFIKGIRWKTEWAELTYPIEVRRKKIAQICDWIEIAS